MMGINLDSLTGHNGKGLTFLGEVKAFQLLSAWFSLKAQPILRATKECWRWDYI